MKITWYTGKGDDGTSETFCFPGRNLKSDVVFEALGNADELNSWLGLIKSSLEGKYVEKIKAEIAEIQNDLFTIQAELSGVRKHIPLSRVAWLQEAISYYGNRCAKPMGFIVPGTTRESALFDVGRTIARRTERSVVRVKEKEHQEIPGAMLSYLNRLSSYLYVCARYLVTKNGMNEPHPNYR